MSDYIWQDADKCPLISDYVLQDAGQNFPLISDYVLQDSDKCPTHF